MSTPRFEFDLIEVIGAGSSSTVVSARPVGEDRLVTLKVLHRDLSGDLVVSARSRDEARLLSQLRHPNIVTVEQLTSRKGCPIVVMEHIDGIDLGTLVRHTPDGLPVAEALEIVRQVASALDAAFGAPGTSGKPLRVVHRDIKPSNVLLSLAGEVKVVDFNLAAAEFDGREAAVDEPVFGSIGYAAPERHATSEVTPAVDVYALGVTLVELLTGRTVVLPRAAERHEAELARLLGHVAPVGLDDEQTHALRGLLSRMCAHAPAARPTAREIGDSLGLIAVRASLGANLARFAAERIPEVRRRRPTIDHAHPDWDRVAFLDADTVPEEHGGASPETTALERILARLGLISEP